MEVCGHDSACRFSCLLAKNKSHMCCRALQSYGGLARGVETGRALTWPNDASIVTVKEESASSSFFSSDQVC